MRQLKISPAITKRNEGTTEMYLKDIGQYDLLDIEWEVDSFKEIELLKSEILDLKKNIDDMNEKYKELTPEENDKRKKYDKYIKKINDEIKMKENKIAEIKDKVIKANLRFVVTVAKQYDHYKEIKLQDLINEWNLWLAKAVDRFDYTRWLKLISYAVRWIRQAILQHISECGYSVRLPMNKVMAKNKFEKAIDQHVKEHWYKPNDIELMDALHTDEDWLKKYKDSRVRIVSWDAPWFENDDNESSFFENFANDTIMPDAELEIQDIQSFVRKTLHESLVNRKISNNEYNVLVTYFWIWTWKEKTLEEVAENLDLSRERIRQIRDRALRKLRKTFSWKELEFLYNSLNN